MLVKVSIHGGVRPLRSPLREPRLGPIWFPALVRWPGSRRHRGHITIEGSHRVSWAIVTVEGAEPTPDLGTVEAAVVVLERDSDLGQVRIELTETAASSGVELDPVRHVHPYLFDDKPPRHLLVTTDGVEAHTG